MAKSKRKPSINSYENMLKENEARHLRHGELAKMKKRRIVAAVPAEPGFTLTTFAVGITNWSHESAWEATEKVIAWGFDQFGKAHALTHSGIEQHYIDCGAYFDSVVLFEAKPKTLMDWKRDKIEEYEHKIGVKLFCHWGDEFPHSRARLVDYYGENCANDGPDWVKALMAQYDKEAHDEVIREFEAA